MSLEELVVLKSIDATLKELLSLSRQRTGRGANAAPVTPSIATDRELDSKYGNGPVRFMPRDWTGPSYKGRPFSDCPPDLLDMLAESYDYFAQKNEKESAVTDRGKPKADFDKRAARCARGWAARIRSGKHTPPPVEETSSGWADEGGY